MNQPQHMSSWRENKKMSLSLYNHSYNVVIGDGTWIGSNVTIMEGARIGKNCNIFPGAVIRRSTDLKFGGEDSLAILVTTVPLGNASQSIGEQ
jgi:acyl-[acyl carrier protein]--UDP-N-acetylglucosamine O-acyltransferase